MNKIIKAIRDGMVQAVVKGELTSLSVPAGTDKLVSIKMSADIFMLTSIDVKCNKSTDFYVEIFERDNTNSMYNSGIRNSRIYDLLDMIYIDKKQTGECLVKVVNSSEFDAVYDIDIRGYLMK